MSTDADTSVDGGPATGGEARPTGSTSAASRRSGQVTALSDPDRVAYFEAAGWRAYYDRKWVRLLRLLVGLCQEQFGIPFPRSLQAAYLATRGSMAWVPIDHDEAKAVRYFTKFYALARRYSGLCYDPARAAQLELRYYDVHRQLVDETDKTPLVEAFVDLHCELFGLSREQARASAEWRTAANNTVDLITGKRSTDVEEDWARIEDYLRRCYRSIQEQLSV
jgi:hypothetical protein